MANLTLVPTPPGKWTIMDGPQRGQPTPEFYRFVVNLLGLAGGSSAFTLETLSDLFVTAPQASPEAVDGLQSDVATLKALLLAIAAASSAEIDGLRSEVATLRALLLIRPAPLDPPAFPPAAPYTYAVPITGFSITVGNRVNYLILDPAGTLAAGTVTMPPAPVDGDEVTVASSQIVTALTVQANSGQTIDGGISAGTFAANAFAKWKYVIGQTTWYRVG